MPHNPISHYITIWNQLRKRIAAEFDLAEDDPVLIDTIDGETNLNERLGWLAEQSIADKHSADAIAARINELDMRQGRLLARSKNARELIAFAMSETGQRNITLPYVTLFTRNGKDGFDIDENTLPDDYRKTVTKLVADREAIAAAVDAGDYPPGVTKRNPQPVLTIKVK